MEPRFIVIETEIILAALEVLLERGSADGSGAA